MKLKQIVVMLLCIMLLFAFTACSSEAGGSIDAEKAELRAQIASLEAQLGAAAEPVQQAEGLAAPAATEDVVIGINAKFDNGDYLLRFSGSTAVTAAAEVPEGMVLDCWKLNGVAEELAEGERPAAEKEFTVSGTTVIEAALRPEYKVTSINAKMQFLNAKDKPDGDKFTEFVFEEDYENPLTKETVPGGSITVNVAADVPKGYAIDYWKINEVPYYFNKTVTSFTVRELDETTLYEVVLREEKAAAATPKPSASPEPEEVAMCTVTCQNYCSFDGGGYSNAKSGQVPKGTVTTVWGMYAYYGWARNGDESFDPGGVPFTYTVNSDVTFNNFIVN